MDRRRFLKNTAQVSALLGGSLAGIQELLPNPQPFDLVAVKGGMPDAMFAKGMEALGGIGAFVKKGQTVLVKPNIGWDVPPERAGNTNPLLVKEIVKQCKLAGAKQVYVFDNTCDQWQRCYKNSGIEAAVKEAGGMLVPGNSESYYHPVTVKGGTHMTSAKEHELVLESDVFINVPVLKSHGGAQLTMAMKNLMGIVWDRRVWHRNGLHEYIADFAAYRKPTLNVLDAYNIMKRNGPRGVSEADVVTMRSLLLSTDMVAIDAAGAKLFGAEPREVPYIAMAEQLGVGSAALESLNIKRITM